MKRLLILGAGTAGTTIVNKLRPKLNQYDWQITIVDEDPIHYYQPGLLFIPFGIYGKKDVIQSKHRFIPDGVTLMNAKIMEVDADNNKVHLDGGVDLPYDMLIIATGTHPHPEETPGLLEGEWYKSIFDFYTLEGALKLAEKLENWEGGHLVVNIMEMPIKCPVAPLEFIFLADWFFTKRGIRDKVDLTYVTPLPAAFTKPVAAQKLGHTLSEKNINLVPDFYTEHVNDQERRLVSYDEEEVAYDLLVTIPVNMGADFVGRSGLGDELNHVPVDKHTFLSTQYDNIFALGDAAAVPTSKAGSVAHFAIELFVDNFLRYIEGETLLPTFDGHANCFVETGFNKALLIDFNYDVEPLPGKFPYAHLGPLNLLEESRLNHWGKLAFKWVYWNLLLKGKHIPIPAQMSMQGKVLQEV